MDSLTAVLYLIGASSIVTAATLWFSPYLCRVAAAALLTHAGTVEGAREFRRYEWSRQMEAVARQAVEVSE